LQLFKSYFNQMDGTSTPTNMSIVVNPLAIRNCKGSQLLCKIS
jgi:hypothetical protein